MKKRSISLIIGFMSVALLGVMAMQYYFIRESYFLKRQLFDQKVIEALNAVVSKVEKVDADNFIKRKSHEITWKKNDDPQAIQNRIDHYTNLFNEDQLKIKRDFLAQDSIIKSNYPLAMQVRNDIYETYINNPAELSKVSLQGKIEGFVDSYGRNFVNQSYELVVDDPDKRILKKPSLDSIRYLDVNSLQFISVGVDPLLKASLSENIKRLGKQRQLLDSVKKTSTSVFEELANDYEKANIPFSQRVNPTLIDTLLKSELSNLNINLPFDYEITSPVTHSILFTSITDKKSESPDGKMYTTALFPKEIASQPGILTLIFPDRGTVILQNMSAILFSSAVLLLALTGCFAYTIFIILRQKKMSEMKTDFINNMTHEFKTPVATIMIASEALKDPEVTEDESRIKRLAGIIYDENVRLGNHIERVLNIAKIDREDLKMEQKDIEMNDLISAVADSMELQLQKKQSKVNLDLQAEHSVVKGDELHLSNVIFNLIDNAIKYSKDEPKINISTHNSGNNIVIRVRDNGIGMNRDQLSKIFEQFYRIPTGNLHDVKGFGLGLSYVSNIIKLLQGTIHVKSEKNKGSEFEIILRAV